MKNEKNVYYQLHKLNNKVSIALDMFSVIVPNEEEKEAFSAIDSIINMIDIIQKKVIIITEELEKLQ